MVKNLDSSENWRVYHHEVGAGAYLKLNTTAAKADSGLTASTSTLIYTAADSATHIVYAFKSIQGFSKFGIYEGNGNADGTFVHTGFRPKFLIAKDADATGGWWIIPSKTDWYNSDTYYLYGHSTTTESNGAFADFYSNGFKLRKNDDINNASTYIYACWAEAPLVNSKGVPCNAR